MSDHVTMRPGYDADWIAPKLWVGSIIMGPVDTSQFDVVIVAAKEHADLSIDPSKKSVVKLDDGIITARESDAAYDAALLVNHHRNSGRRVLVACSMGINRSALIAALALVIEGDLEPIGRVRTKRKAPDDGQVLRNRTFVDLVHMKLRQRQQLLAQAAL